MSIIIDLMRRYPNAMKKNEAVSLYQEQSESYKKHVDETTFVRFFSSRSRDVLFGHDYEATDSDAQKAAPLQIAGIYTDAEFNALDEPIEVFCKLHGDKLPSPMAIEITKIAPSFVIEKGESEPVFFHKVNRLLSLPNTCSYGYNSIRYDDVVTRFGLFRNLLPPYAREFKNGNSRWDAMSVTLAFYANHKNNPALVWPSTEEGKPTFKLEKLCEANGIVQEHAHNAVDDVKAMIDWLSKLQSVDPALMNHCYTRRKKQAIQSVVYPGSKIYLPSLFAGEDKDYCYKMIILGGVPGDKNKFFGIDVRDIQLLRNCYKLTAEEIGARLFMSNDQLQEAGVERPPLVTFAVNQCPSILTESTPVGANTMPSIPDPQWSKALLSQHAFIDKLGQALKSDHDTKNENPELKLYEGFPSNYDADLQNRVENTALPEAYDSLPKFEGAHFNELKRRVDEKMRDELSPEWAKHRRAAREELLASWYPDESDRWSAYWDEVDAVITDDALKEDLKNTVTMWFKEEDAVIEAADKE